MEAQTILKLIETVDPQDTAKLDEIDARVWCLIRNEEFVRLDLSPPQGGRDIHSVRAGEPQWYGFRGQSHVEYTRSRDRLKAIRPEGWSIESAYRYGFGYDCQYGQLKAPRLPTEELAELHAIIQAIASERNNATPGGEG